MAIDELAALEKAFPSLSRGGYKITSPATVEYNCIAWAAGEDDAWWWPDPMSVAYWPPTVPREETVEAFQAAYQALGFAPCASGEFEAGFEKIALYADGVRLKHAARQLPNGMWTSKLGQSVDIQHGLEALEGRSYGKVIGFLRRAVTHQP